MILCAQWETALFYLFYAFAILAGLNWFFVGVGEWSLISAITGSRQLRGNNAGSRVLYTIIGLLTLASLAFTLVFVFKNDPSCFVTARPSTPGAPVQPTPATIPAQPVQPEMDQDEEFQ